MVDLILTQILTLDRDATKVKVQTRSHPSSNADFSSGSDSYGRSGSNNDSNSWTLKMQKYFKVRKTLSPPN